ncbi:MAG: hypothetical protein IKQ44_09325 [Lachnospiraceae bacterium]|nr:hypothetical protein [Lachnospiraceae bacterium]
MRKKNFGSKKATKAIALGLSAMIATSQPIMLMAEEAPAKPAAPATPEKVETVEQKALNEVNAEIQEADQAINEVKENKLTSVQEAVNGLSDIGLVEPKTEDVGENGEPVVEQTTNSLLEGMANELKNDMEPAKQIAETLSSDVTDIDSKDSFEKAAASVLAGKETEASKKIDETVQGYEKAIEDTKDAIADDDKKIINAATIPDAQKAFEDINKRNKDLKEKFETAKKDIADIEEDLAKAKKAQEEAQTAFNNAADKGGDDAKAEKEKLEKAEKAALDLENKAKDAKDRADALDKEIQKTLTELSNNGYQKILDEQDALDGLTKELADLDEGSDDYAAKQKEIEDKKENISKLIIESYIKSIKGTGVTFGTDTREIVTGFKKGEDGEYIIGEDGNGIPETETKIYKTVTYKDAEGNDVISFYEVSENGEINALTSEIQNDNFVRLREGKDAVPEVDGYFADGDQEKAKLDTNDENAIIVTKDGSDDKYVPNFDDKRTDSNRKYDDPKNGNGTVYTAISGSQTVTYGVGETLAFNKEGTGTETVVDKKISSNGGKSEMKKDVKDIIDSYNLNDGYTITINYSTLFQNKTYTIDSYNSKDNFWASVDNALADFLGTSSYSVTLTHTADKVEGILENTYQDYEKVTTTSKTIVDRDTGYWDTRYSESEANRRLEEAIKDALKGTGATYEKGKTTYTVKIDENTVRTITVNGKVESHGIAINKGYNYDLKVSYEDVKTETYNQLIKTDCYGADTYKYVHVDGQAAIAEVWGTTTKLNEVKGGSLKEETLETSLEDQKKAVEDNTKLQKEYATATTNYQTLANAAANAKKEVNDAKIKVESLETTLRELKRTRQENEALKAKLEQAKIDLANLKEKADALDEEVKKAGQDLQDVIKKLTPKDDPSSSDDDNNDGDSSTSDDGTVSATIASTNTNAGITIQTQNGTGTNRTRANGANVNDQNADDSVSIDNNQVALSDGSDIKDPKVEDNKNNNSSKNIGDNEKPLAAMPNMEDGSVLDYLWWLILVALFGVATATAMYQNYKKKAEARQQAKKN